MTRQTTYEWAKDDSTGRDPLRPRGVALARSADTTPRRHSILEGAPVMSSFLYGALTRDRLVTRPPAKLQHVHVPPEALVHFFQQPAEDGREAAPTQPLTEIKHWQDVLVALVPAEVLALHALAMTYGTTTTQEGEEAVTVLTDPTEMSWVFAAMAVLAMVLYLVGVKRFGWTDVARGLIASAAFVLWTMVQPSTAFDALGLELSGFVRIMIAVFGAVILGILVNALAKSADATQPASTGGDA